jgi:FAD/FMN-containing dehydrogenase/Fe-S oxidoreductase
MATAADFGILKQSLDGEVFTDTVHLIAYATDASAYRETPVAVAYPKNVADIKKLIDFARAKKIPLIPRTAGTSLAGQVVGNGIVVDVSRYLNRILEINEAERWVMVEPGVVLDELNKILEKSELFFAPETSTSSRCMIGGMVGNNSCGAHSLVYGSTRDHLLEVHALLSDGSEVVFNNLNHGQFLQKCNQQNLEGSIYRQIHQLLSDKEIREEITLQYPDKSIRRRNTGYAMDLLMDSVPFCTDGEDFSFCKLIAGSEGTLAFITKIKLNLVPLSPPVKGLVCVHLLSVPEALHANLIALKFKPVSIELMDKAIMDLSKESLGQSRNRFFIEGDPGAILIVEFAEESEDVLLQKSREMEQAMRQSGYGYHFPLVRGSDIKNVWDLRKAGLGVLSNYPGDAKPVSVIEDTAVSPDLLPEFISDLQQVLDRLQLSVVYYAHIATGEIHVKPVLNLKSETDVEKFRTVAYETALLVKKYKGSLSGEHGDGRLRGEFIPLMIGEKNYQLLKEIKHCWDPAAVFNPGKITDTPVMSRMLRYDTGLKNKEIASIFDFSKEQGMLRAIEKCNGSADCRKTEIMGGTMCPSYMATRNEKNTTRARANILREFLTHSSKLNSFDHSEIYEVMDLCLSCKGCMSECPSNIDMAKFKAEFLQHYYDANGSTLRSKLVADITSISRMGSVFPTVYNFFVSNKITARVVKSTLGFAEKRSLPKLHKCTLRQWFRRFEKQKNTSILTKGKVWFFIDEFTKFIDCETGITAIKLLTHMGYNVCVPRHKQSGRTYLSKGFLRKAVTLANYNVAVLSKIISDNEPLIGIEPSAILTFRDEYAVLVSNELKQKAENLSKNCLLFEEFFMQEFSKGNINSDDFINAETLVKLHGHCHQKSIATIAATKQMLEIIPGIKVEEIKSGCCGMAGSFGFEKEHYEVSMQIGELVLFPEIRKSERNVIIAAPGTSCRQQIFDGTGRKARHPLEIMYSFLKRN